MASSNQSRSKTKNKVGSPPPSKIQVDTTRIDYSSSADGESVGSDTSQGLPKAIQTQLLEDIESSGGIEQFVLNAKNLAKFCSQNTSVYGERADPIRRQIRNKVYKWKALYKKGKYADVLKSLNVKSYQYRQAQNSVANKKQGQNKLADDSSDDGDSSLSSSGSESDAGTLPRSIARAAGSAKKTPRKAQPSKQQESGPKQTTPVAPKQTTPVAPKQTTPVASFKPTSLLSLQEFQGTMDDNVSPSRRDLAIPSDAEHIRVNPVYPERNGPFMIFPVNDIEGVEANKVFPGFAILFEADVRHGFDSRNDQVEYFSARTFPPNKVLIRVPSWPYCLYSNADRAQLQASLNPNYMNALDSMRNNFFDNREQRMWRHYLLEFEPFHQLSARVIFRDASDDHNLPAKIIPIKYTHPQMKGIYNVKHYMCYSVARIEQGAKQYGAVANQATMTASAMDALGSNGGF
jgi:hypothetical protein